ncbi:MAG: HAD hydrolase-like protein, partial [Planctomycetaceae bacterium]|nr:HAD hydrolase-like protein [Planctomycetaceae bacterium]
GGVEMGYRSVLVLSGGTSLSDLANFAYQPDLVVDSIADLNNDEFFQYERPRFHQAERLLA